MSRGSRCKRDREFAKAQEKLRKQKAGKAKPSGSSKGLILGNDRRIGQRKLPLQFRRVGKGWFPAITQEIIAAFKRRKHPNVGQYVYYMDISKSDQTHFVFDVRTGQDLSTPRERRGYFGTFFIDLKNNTISKGWEGTR